MRTPSARRDRAMIPRLTVQRWFHVVLACMILLVIAGTFAGARVIGRTGDVSDRLLDRTMPAIAESYRLQNALINQETGLRGYALTADAQFLAPYNAGRQQQDRSTARLRDLLTGQPELLADLGTVARLADQWHHVYAEPLSAATTSGAVHELGSATADSGKTIFDRLRIAFDTQNEHLAQARDHDVGGLRRARAVRDSVLVGMIVLFVLTALALTLLVRGLVARPLRYLTNASRQVADGDFDRHIDAHGPADLAAVATAVEEMRRRIVTDLGASRDAGAILEQQKISLDAQAVELRRSNAELEQFAYVASHDLQEPLRKVASFCQLLDKRYGDKLDERGKEYLHYAVDGAKRMQLLINDLLTFSRVGRSGRDSVPTALDQPLDKAIGNLSSLLEETGAQIERPDALPEIVGESVLLTMLWQNLLGNAIKFRRPAGEPVVRVTCAPDEIPGGWRFSVSDNGIGIAPEFAEKVFVIFQRLHSREEYGGTGIGLAICKKIVEYHGGRIWIDTDYTEGTRFWFTLRGAGAVPIEIPEPEGANA
ncbi:sensor histidine kinase [Nocardia miyunensis]|uniref:sensor histidine kinase n=1 Tax=Nocardia miyunensis TaxID=282684 RepID=UPI00082DE2A6|nr:CHASE3 domain-containing protein [Nocardia miyunensis]